jgi:hypothetical protein
MNVVGCIRWDTVHGRRRQRPPHSASVKPPAYSLGTALFGGLLGSVRADLPAVVFRPGDAAREGDGRHPFDRLLAAQARIERVRLSVAA